MAKFKEWLSEEGLKMISEWAEQGLTDRQIAGKMGISVSSFHEWKRKYPNFLDSLKRSKAAADQEVESSLFQSALGYYVEETVTENRTTTKTTKKWIAPSITAQIFWLKNRQPDKWRDKVVQEVENESDRNIGIVMLPSRIPDQPPEDMTDRQQLIEYYEQQIRAGVQQDFEDYSG